MVLGEGRACSRERVDTAAGNLRATFTTMPPSTGQAGGREGPVAWGGGAGWRGGVARDGGEGPGGGEGRRGRGGEGRGGEEGPGGAVRGRWRWAAR